ncbi:hypothetical protein [Amycolatopsis eburnea]|uniref:Uncharacterized protein n=1 Tax=Amycolatopsis eburnea TaxID=2267691 RepID=A0A3R9FPE7_9PSEU|nr:hypothetical protein [Amycolatopsis eburnea]RSD20114.1 hypothetical protein EIY87_18055 [Amycolatopsis eburnea]
MTRHRYQPQTGPEHYATANFLINQVENDGNVTLSHEHRMERIGLAQVHATLALAAATALGARMNNGASPADGEDWAAITNVPKRGERT